MRWTEDDLQKHLGRSKMLSQKISKVIGIASAKPPLKPKFGNRKTTSLDGLIHDSGKEARRWQELQLLQVSGAISNLRRQVSYDLCVNGMLICRYVADAVYVENGAIVVEDTKSEPTRKLPVFAIKRKLMRAVHGIEIAIV